MQLIIACEQKVKDAAEKESLSAELASMKPSGRKKRAIAAGATEDEADDAGDADDPVDAFVALVMEKEGQQQARTAGQPGSSSPIATRPHFGTAPKTGSKAGYLQSLFGTKHCMFSYVRATTVTNNLSLLEFAAAC
eukprot:COSAG02_NODE_18634_length_928_cov_1.089264_1_plen_136_part_00